MTKEGNHVALTNCFFCGKADKIILHKRLGDVSMYHGKVVDLEPCNECKDLMLKGVILIGIDNEKSDPGWNNPGDQKIPNPYRSGHFLVVTQEAVHRILDDGPVKNFALKNRWVFVDHRVAEELLRQHNETKNG